MHEFDRHVFAPRFLELQKRAGLIARAHGFRDHEHHILWIPAAFALIMTELAEALEAHRRGQTQDVGPELADIVIRVMDLADTLKIDLAMEILEKMDLNEARPIKHGGKLY